MGKTIRVQKRCIYCGRYFKAERLVIPAVWFKGEIQDEIRLKKQCGCWFFVVGEGMQDTRLDCRSG